MPSPSSPSADGPVRSLTRTNAQLTRRSLANVMCDFLGVWAQTFQTTTNRTLILHFLSYLFSVSFPHCSSSVLTLLVLHLSLASNDYKVILECVRRLPASYFNANYKTIVKNVSKVLLEGIITPFVYADAAP